MPLGGAVFSPEWNFDSQTLEKGRIKRMTEHFPQGDVVHVFDEKGRKMLRTFPDKNTRKKVEYRMFYDSKDKLARVECSIEGKLVFVEKGTYDNDGVLRAVVRYNARNQEEFSTTMLVYEKDNVRLKNYGIQSADGIVDYYYEYNTYL